MNNSKSKKTTLLTILMASAALTAILTTPASAKNYFVGITTPWDTADGGHYSAATAANLIAAVKAARNNTGVDTIYAGTGRYYLTEELILSDVLLGGYQNGATRHYPASIGAGNGSDLDKMTILDGNSLRTTVSNELVSRKHRVATIKTGGVIDGCLIRNGHARSTTSAASMVKHGGGVLLKGGSICNSILRGNVAFNPGGSSFKYNSGTPKNSTWNITAPAKGGAVYIDVEGGNVVNCLIYSNMDDLGLGIDYAAENTLTGDANIINNTVVNNANCPRMAYLVNTAGFKIINNYNDMKGSGKTYYLSQYYISSTETTCGQFACFLNAIEPEVSGNTVKISKDDLSAMLASYAPLSGHKNKTVRTVLSIGKVVNTTKTAWDLYSVNTTDSKDNYGRLYYSSTSKIFGPHDAGIVHSGESIHCNNYACSYVSWYGGMAYSIWLGGMLPTLAQWYYGGCATNNNGGKAATSHYPSPTVMEVTPSTSYNGDAKLDAIAWYGYNSGPTTGSMSNRHVHEVAKKAPNKVGLYDVSGNLWEWCLDWYESDAYTGGRDGVSAVSDASDRVIRGGYWGYYPYYCSLGYRNARSPGYLDYYIGFRVVVVP